MAENTDMAQNADWEALLTKPMSEAEMAEYQGVLDSEAFQDMVRSYHADAALSAIRYVLLAWFKDGASLEATITALVNVWLDCMIQVEPRMDEANRQNWRRQPQLLVQILYQQAVATMQENEAQLQKHYPPELQELYQQWAQVLPAPLGELQPDDPAVAGQMQQLVTIYEQLSEFRATLEASELKLDSNDYLEVWTMVLLQVLIFGQIKQPELYFTIETNWQFFLSKLSGIVTLMFLLKGQEHMLLPENNLLLAAHVQTPEFTARVEQFIE